MIRKILFLIAIITNFAAFSLTWAGESDPVIEGKAITGPLVFDTGAGQQWNMYLDGGTGNFSIKDYTNTKYPFLIEPDSPGNSFRISPNGISIGTGTPNEKLTVEGAISFDEITAPLLTAGYGKLYVKTADSLLYFKDDGGTEYDLTNKDKIIEGDTHVEVIDTGDGYIVFTEDGAEVGRFSSGNFGIGRIPTQLLDIQKDGSAIIRATSYSNTDYICPQIAGYKARGTAATPTAVLLGDRLLNLSGFGYDGTNFSGTRASILFKAAESWNATNQGTTFTVKTTPTGSTTRTERIYVDGNGNIALGGTSPNEKLTVEGNLSLKEGTAPGHTANYGKFYVKSSDSLPYFKTGGGVEHGLTGSGEDWVLFNVMDYGAYKDGTHASETTTAWTNAINAANGAVYSPGVVFAPPGDYLITPGSLPAINCHIYAPGTLITSATSGVGNLFHVTHTSATHRFFTVGMIIGYTPNAKDGSSRTVYLYKLTGTVSVSSSNSAVTGSGTSFNSEAAVGDPILISGEEFTISAVIDNTHLTLSANHVAGASGVTAYMNAKHTGQGLFIDSSGSCTYKIDRIAGFDVGLRLDNYTSVLPVSENIFTVNMLGYNNYGILLNNATATHRIEANRFQIGYMALNWTYSIHLAARHMCNDNYFEILNLELHLREGHGIYLDGTNCFRNAFICPNQVTGTLGNGGYVVYTTSGAHDNFFRMCYCDFTKTSISAGNVFDLLSNEFTGNFANAEAPKIGDGSGRSQFMRDAPPTGGSNYFREGDICWNNTPSDGTMYWVCTVSGAPGTWVSKTGGGTGDKISEGNSLVEVVDAGTGHISLNTDGTERALLNGNYLGIRSNMYLDLSKEANQGTYYLKRNSNHLDIAAGGNYSAQFYSDHVVIPRTYLLVDSPSGDGDVIADGAGATDYGSLRCKSAGSNRAYLAGNNTGTHLAHTGSLIFKTITDVNTATLDVSGNFYAYGNITAGGNCCVDYVFEEDYVLMSLDDLKDFIQEKNHLPNITIGEDNKVGLISSIGELLEKTEEQALYILQLHERLETLEARLN